MIAQHSSESNEHYTPKWIIDICRRVLGRIELDPASSDEANLVVKAHHYFTEQTNGLLQDWRGFETVFVNPPGGVVDEECRTVIRASKAKGRKACAETGACGLPPGHKHFGVTSSAATWWLKMDEWWEQNRGSGIYLAFSLEILQTAQTYNDCVHPLDFTGCVLKERIKFEQNGVPGEQPTHANMLVLLTEDEKRIRMFRELLEPYGKVFTPR